MNDIPTTSDAPETFYRPGQIPQRSYGQRGLKLSMIGLGGIVVMETPQEQANRNVARAVEAGVNYIDFAPTYGDAEQLLGEALAPYRKDCFLACKTICRDAPGARAGLEGSLARLRTDYFDLFQLHAITDPVADVDAAFAKGGAMEVLLEAKKAGQVRHLGFSAHSVEAAFAALDRYEFDSFQFPVNFATYYAGNFGPSVLDRARKEGRSVMALKAMAKQRWPKEVKDRGPHRKCWYQPLTDPRESDLALRFTLSRPVAAVLPPGDEALFWRAVEVAMNYRPLTAEEDQAVRALAATVDPLFRA
jgi:aryl-alcohol dehydrogenase-like predicted oxidoreductase